MRYVRASDGAPVTEAEATIGGVLRSGYALMGGVPMRDAAPQPGRVVLHDSGAGDGGLHAAAAYLVMCDRDANAWRNPPNYPTGQTQDAAHRQEDMQLG